MNSINLILNSGVAEETSSSVLELLYTTYFTLSSGSTLMPTGSSLKGIVHTPYVYKSTKLFLELISGQTDNINNFIINADKQYLKFLSPVIENYMKQYGADKIGITDTDLITITHNSFTNRRMAINSSGSSDFPELGLFSNIKELGNHSFLYGQCPRTIDLSNIEEIGFLCFGTQNGNYLNTSFTNTTGSEYGVMDLPKVKRILYGALGYMTLVLEINLPALEEIVYVNPGNWNFYKIFAQCLNLTTIRLGPNLTKIEAPVAISNLNYADALTTLEWYPKNLIKTTGLFWDRKNSGVDILPFINLTEIARDYKEQDGGFFIRRGGSAFYTNTTKRYIKTSDTNYPWQLKAIYFPKLQILKGCVNYLSGWRTYDFGVDGNFFDNSFIQCLDLMYFRDLTTLNGMAFKFVACHAMVINNVVPPTLNVYESDVVFNEHGRWTSVDIYANSKIDPFCNVVVNNDPSEPISSSTRYFYDTYHCLETSPMIDAIYVPDSAVNTYKSASGWSTAKVIKTNGDLVFVSDIIKGISELNGGVTYQTEDAWRQAGRPLALIDEYM